MNKKAQAIDMEVITSPGFAILFLGAAAATLLGWLAGKKMGFGAFPLWQILITIVVEAVASYIIVARGQ